MRTRGSFRTGHSQALQTGALMIRQQHLKSEFDARLQLHVEFPDYVFVGNGADMNIARPALG